MGLLFMRKETEEWLRIAHEEYQAARALIKEDLYRMVCYHAQQTVEKLLKAILTEHEIEFSRTHNLLDLRNATASMGYEIGLSDEEAVFLNSVYRARYPAMLGFLPEGDPVRDDAAKAIRIAEKIVRFVRVAFPTKGDGSET